MEKNISVPAQRHSLTSVAAGVGIAPKAPILREQVYLWLLDRGAQGATDEEMQDGLGMGANTQRPRRVSLLKTGRVVDSKQKRRTRSGAFATVWVAVA